MGFLHSLFRRNDAYWVFAQSLSKMPIKQKTRQIILINLPSTPLASSWRAMALIDLDSLRHNINQIRQVTQARLMAVIKADAYGHGLETICAAMHDRVDAFAVATIAEGIQCRRVQKNKPIVVLSELWQQQQLQYFEQYRLQAVLHNQQQIKWLEAYQGNPLSVWIKFDSGMNRLGVAPESVETIYRKCENLRTVKVLRLMSHLANADILGNDFTRMQLEVFKRVTNKLGCEKSLANSAAVMRWPTTHFSWVRPGLMLYGVAPYTPHIPHIPQTNKTPPGEPENCVLKKFDLRPVMQLQARLIAIKTIAADQAVGYGGIFRTRRVSKIAVVGFGYGDGYPRLEHPQAYVLIHNRPATIIGQISMDMITVDVTDLDRVKVGDEVTLWGADLGVEKVAQWAGTIPYELLCKVTARVARLPVN